jgi:hypothetical protein
MIGSNTMTTKATKTRISAMQTIILFVVFTALALLLLQYSETTDDEDKILSDLELLSDGKSPTSFVGTLDFICFGFIYMSSEGCPAKLLSTKTAVIDLVKNNESKCVEINKFNFSIEPRSARCFAPNKLNVVKINLAPDRENRKASVPHFQIREIK